MDLEGIRTRLEAIADELTEAGIELLQEAVSDGAERAPAQEKQIAKARRAVLKAIHDLEGGPGQTRGYTDDWS